MKKTQFIETLKNIRRTLTSFLAIFLFLCLGVSIYLGFGWCTRGMKDSTSNMLLDKNTYDFDLSFTLGISEEDIDKLLIDEVDLAYGTYVIEESYELSGFTQTARVRVIQDGINNVEILEGRLPENEFEIAVEKNTQLQFEFKIGDKITFGEDLGTETEVLNEIFKGSSIENLLKLKDTEGSCLNSKEFTITGVVRSPLRANNSRSNTGYSALTGKMITSDFFVNEVAVNKNVMTEYNRVFLRCSCYENSPYTDENVTSRLIELRSKLSSIAKEINQKKIDTLASFIDNDLPKLKPMISFISDKDMAEKANKYIKLIEDYKDSLPLLAPSVSTRSETSAYKIICSITETVESSKMIFGGVFIGIGLLVCYSVITRLVNDQTKLTGTKMALGIFPREIVLSYLLYGGLCSVLATILGVFLSYFVIGRVLIDASTMYFVFDINTLTFDWKYALILCVSIVLVIELIVFFSVLSVSKQKPINLINGTNLIDDKKTILEKTGLWRKLSLWNKTIIKNFVNDRRRVFGTLIGISGCGILIVCSLILFFNIKEPFEKQINNWYHYDGTLSFDADSETAEQEIRNVFDKYGIKYTKISQSIGVIGSENVGRMPVFIYIIDDSFRDFLEITLEDGSEYDYKSPILVEALKHYHNLDNNISMDYIGSDGTNGTIKFSNYFRYYLDFATIFIGEEEYKNTFGKEAKFDTFVFNGENTDMDSLLSEMSNIDGVFAYENVKKALGKDFELFLALGYAIVALYAISSALMAISVIYNILSTYIDEKKYELITLMINGFSPKKAKKYIYLDTIVLAGISVIISTVLGIVIGYFLVKCFDNEFLYLTHGPKALALILGDAYTALVTLVITLVALRKIDKFKLSDINKA